MSLSKKDYQALAAGVRGVRLDIANSHSLTIAEKIVARAVVNSLVLRQSEELKRARPEFNCGKFHDACDLNPPTFANPNPK